MTVAVDLAAIVLLAVGPGARPSVVVKSVCADPRDTREAIWRLIAEDRLELGEDGVLRPTRRGR